MKVSRLLAPAVLLAVCSGAAGTVFPTGPHVGFDAVPFGNEQDTCLHQVFASALFSGASGGNSVRITAISLAPVFNETYFANIGVRLGYTNAVPGAAGASGLQPPSNLLGGGAPNALGAVTTFLPPGTHTYNFASASASNFQLILPGQAFIYDPSQENLLVEIVTSVHGGVPSYNEPVSAAAGGSDASLAYNSTRYGAAAAPTQALRMDFTFTAVATGACCFGDGSCRFIASQNCTAQGGVYSGSGVTCSQANCAGGACCVQNGTCSFIDSASCLNADGVYRGIGVTCAQADCADSGACCRTDGTCTFGLPSACAAQGGFFSGAGVICNEFQNPCAQPSFIDCRGIGSFTDLLADPNSVPLGGGDDISYAFVSSVTNPIVTTPNLYACTNGFITDNPAFTQYPNGTVPVPGISLGLWGDWDDLYVDTAAGGMVYHLSTYEYTQFFQIPIPVEIVEWSHVRTYAGGAGSATGNFEIKIYGSHALTAADPNYGPRGAVVQYLYQGMAWDWNGNSSTVGFQSGLISGVAPGLNGASSNTPGGPLADRTVCSVYLSPGPCWVNCDGSYQPPILNVNDISCFLNRYASGDLYANCDQSTTPPVLNVNDFACFLNLLAAGCP